MVWYGTVRYGTVWYGTVWYGMVWYLHVCITAQMHAKQADSGNRWSICQQYSKKHCRVHTHAHTHRVNFGTL